MAERMGGYIFVALSETAPLIGPITQVLAALPPARLSLCLPRRADLGFLPATRDEIVATLETVNEDDLYEYQIGFLIPGFYPILQFERRGKYAAIRLIGEPASFRVLDGDPAHVAVFAYWWIDLCQAVNAIAGYYSEMWNGIKKDFADAILNEIETQELRNLRSGAFWLTYLDANIIQHQDQRTILNSRFSKAEYLPTGAFVKWGWRYNPVLPDERELPLEAAWILRHLETAEAVPGVSALIEQTRNTMQQLAEGMQALAARRATEEATIPPSQLSQLRIREALRGSLDEKKELEHAARLSLDTIRSLWAAAYQRPGLVGVNQPVSWAREDSQEDVIVPIIAAHGQEWLLVSNHDPLTIKDSTWTGVDEPLEPRVRELLAAAQQHLIAGQPPRVVVFCWQGIADDMRSTLSAMGAQIEVAPVPVPLLEP